MYLINLVNNVLKITGLDLQKIMKIEQKMPIYLHYFSYY